MSLKPPKKSDLNKGWMKKRLDREIKIQLDIYGEGDNTLSLFEKAKNRAGENPNGYKHVWVVYEAFALFCRHTRAVVQYTPSWNYLAHTAT